jgi:hypothetical protein
MINAVGPRPAATMSEAVDEELRYRMADSLAALGRGEDTEIAHVSLGEIVLCHRRCKRPR